MSLFVKRYEISDKKNWDLFVKSSKNGHFIIYRDYMDYHSDRFDDMSLMVFDSKKRLLAILPANLKGTTLFSHQGLTFGGLVFSPKITAEQVNSVFTALVEFLKSFGGIDKVVYKRIPDFYHNYPSQEDLYSLFRLDANLIRRDLSVAVDLRSSLPYQERRRRNIKKAIKSKVEVSEDEGFADFWPVLNDVLHSNHGVTSVHSLEEIELLGSRFPQNIKCFTARLNGEVLAGIIVFETTLVAHTQYLANSSKGRDLGALDLVIDYLIKEKYRDKRYLDFGISTEDNGRTLNSGLLSQKEGFGARAVIHDFYELEIK